MLKQYHTTGTARVGFDPLSPTSDACVLLSPVPMHLCFLVELTSVLTSTTATWSMVIKSCSCSLASLRDKVEEAEEKINGSSDWVHKLLSLTRRSTEEPPGSVQLVAFKNWQRTKRLKGESGTQILLTQWVDLYCCQYRAQ